MVYGTSSQRSPCIILQVFFISFFVSFSCSAIAQNQNEWSFNDISQYLGQAPDGDRQKRGKALVEILNSGACVNFQLDIPTTLELGRLSADSTLADAIRNNYCDAVKIRFRGSDTIGSRLMPNLVRHFLNQRNVNDATLFIFDAEHLRFVGTREGLPYQVEIVSDGSAKGFEAVENKQADIIMASRGISESERRRIGKAHRIAENQIRENNIARDRLIVLVNPINSIERINIRQLRSIIKGEQTDWLSLGSRVRQRIDGDVNGPQAAVDSSRIKVCSRDGYSGTFSEFIRCIGISISYEEQRRFPVEKGFTIHEGNVQVSECVSTNPLAIGFTPVALKGNAKELLIDEADEPFCDRYLRLYTLPSERYRSAIGLEISEFIKYVSGSDGQLIVEQTGYIPVGKRLDHAPCLEPGNSKIGTVSFGFNSSKVDTAQSDPLRGLFARHPGANHFSVVGYTDDIGTAEANEEISRRRAAAVAGKLEDALPRQRRASKDPKIEYWGCGIRREGNDTEQGRSRNRVVEIWTR